MSLIGLITFIAGTKAKAIEVNTNFNLVKSFVDTLESNVEQNTSDIETLDTGKADVNGDASNRFAVADAVNDTDAVNKQTLFNYTHNAQGYINGLSLAKTASDTVSMELGSAFDSTFTHIMILDTSVSLTNSSQGASTTYYIYLIAKEDGTTQGLISSDSVTPSLPSGYLYFRQIGYYTTNSDNKIDLVVNNDIITPDYIVERTHGSNYVITKFKSGYMEIQAQAPSAQGSQTVVFPERFKSMISLSFLGIATSDDPDYGSIARRLTVTTTTPKYYTGFTCWNGNRETAGTGYETMPRFYEAKGYFR